MRIKDICLEMEKLAPFSLAEEGDNIGLLVGNEDAECTGVMIALDCTLDVVRQAAAAGANLIVVHHPFIWNAMRRIDTSEPVGKVVDALLKNGMHLYCAHTNLDAADKGNNSTLSDMLGAVKKRREGIGYVAQFDKKIKLSELAKRVSSVLGDKAVKVAGDSKKTIKTAYIISGGGGGDSEWYETAKRCADVFITGDVKHYIFINAVLDDFPVIEFSHYYSEIISSSIIFEHLKSAFGGFNIKIAKQKCPYSTLEELN